MVSWSQRALTPHAPSPIVLGYVGDTSNPKLFILSSNSRNELLSLKLGLGFNFLAAAALAPPGPLEQTLALTFAGIYNIIYSTGKNNLSNCSYLNLA